MKRVLVYTGGLWLPQFSSQLKATAFSPTSLALTGWWEAPYAGAPLVARASAGTSGANGNLTAGGGGAPAVGAAQNGFASADFDGAAKSLVNANNMGSFFASAASSMWFLALATVAAADAGAAAYYQNPSLLSDSVNGYTVLSFSTSGVRLGTFDTVLTTFDSVPIAQATGSYFLAQARFDNASMDLRVNSSGISSLARGQAAIDASPLQIGRNFNGSALFTGRVLSIGTSQTKFTLGQFDQIKAYLNSKFALAL